MPAASATTVNRVDAGLRASSRSPWLRSRTTLSEIITAQTSGTPDYFRLARGVGYDSHHEDAHCPLYPAQHITTAATRARRARPPRPGAKPGGPHHRGRDQDTRIG